MSPDKDENTLQCLASWKQHLNGYEIREWNSETFPYQDFLWTKEAAEAKKWAFVTDYFRLWVLYNYGGIYMDADMLLKKNFDDFLNCSFMCGTEYTQQIGSHCMASVQGHKFVKLCLDFYDNRSFKYVKDNNLLQEIIIPRVMTYLLAKNYNVISLVNYSNRPIEIDDGIHIYGDNYFTFDIGDGRNVGVHQCMGGWRDSTTYENPVYMEVLKKYYLKRLVLDDPIKFKYLFIPPLFLRWYYKYKLKIKNLRTITNIKKFM